MSNGKYRIMKVASISVTNSTSGLYKVNSSVPLELPFFFSFSTEVVNILHSQVFRKQIAQIVDLHWVTCF